MIKKTKIQMALAAVMLAGVIPSAMAQDSQAPVLAFKKYVFDGGDVINRAPAEIKKWDGQIPAENTPDSEIDLEKIIFSQDSISLASPAVGTVSKNSLTITNLMSRPIFLVRLPAIINPNATMTDNGSCKVLESGKSCEVNFTYTPQTAETKSELVGFFGKFISVVTSVQAPVAPNSGNSKIEIPGVDLAAAKTNGIYGSGDAITISFSNTSKVPITPPAISVTSTPSVTWSIINDCASKASISPGEKCNVYLRGVKNTTEDTGSSAVGTITINGETFNLKFIDPAVPVRTAQASDISLVYNKDMTEVGATKNFHIPEYTEYSRYYHFLVKNVSTTPVMLGKFGYQNNSSSNIKTEDTGTTCKPTTRLAPGEACIASLYVGGVLSSSQSITMNYAAKSTVVKFNLYDASKEVPNIVARYDGNYVPVPVHNFGASHTGATASKYARLYFTNLGERWFRTDALTQKKFSSNDFRLVYTNCDGEFRDDRYYYCTADFEFSPTGKQPGEYTADVVYAGTTLTLKAKISSNAPMPGDIKFVSENSGNIRNGSLLETNMPVLWDGQTTLNEISLLAVNTSDRHIQYEPLKEENVVLAPGFDIQNSSCYISQLIAPGGACAVKLRFNGAGKPVGKTEAVFQYMDDTAKVYQEVKSAAFDPALMYVYAANDLSGKKLESFAFPPAIYNGYPEAQYLSVFNKGPGYMRVPAFVVEGGDSPIYINTGCSGQLIAPGGICNVALTLNAQKPIGKYTRAVDFGGQKFTISAIIYSTVPIAGDVEFRKPGESTSIAEINMGKVIHSLASNGFGKGREFTIDMHNVSGHVLNNLPSYYSVTPNIKVIENPCSSNPSLWAGSICRIKFDINMDQPEGTYVEKFTFKGNEFQIKFQAINSPLVNNGGIYEIPGESMYSCNEYLTFAGVQIPSGRYKLNDGAGSSYPAYCDMTYDGGGWTLINSRLAPNATVSVGTPQSLALTGASLGMEPSRFSFLYGKSTMLRAVPGNLTNGMGIKLSDAAIANCVPFNVNTNLTNPSILHSDYGCDVRSSDYTMIGIGPGRITYMNAESDMPVYYTKMYGADYSSVFVYLR